MARISDLLFGDKTEVLAAQHDAEMRRAAALASIRAADEEEARALSCIRSEASQSAALSRTARSVRPQTLPDPEELKS